jgi:biotin carboxylase
MGESSKKVLWVIGAGGAPFEYVLPKLARYAEVFAFLAVKANAEGQNLLKQWCADVVYFDGGEESEGITPAVVQAARRFEVDGIVTFSELGVMAVAQACQELGLPGPGPNAVLARDKWLMRQRWAEAGIPVPKFAKVDSLQDLEDAARKLRKPFLLKPSGRGGGIGQQVIDEDTSLRDILTQSGVELDRAAQRGFVEYTAAEDFGHYVAEEIIQSTTDSWYDDPRYGDYLSVEGIVARGVYHPICITARLPTLPSYAETVALSPCVLREDQQREIERLSAAAVDALGLETCATHTEIKLMANGEMCLLETAARTVGSTATAIAESVFGVDIIGLQVAEALGIPQVYPERMLVEGKGAGAVVYLFGADSAGRPWSSEVPFTSRLDWSELVSPASHIEIIPSQLAPEGTIVRPYNPGAGAMNYVGAIQLHSSDPETLLVDAYRLMDGLEAALAAAQR